MLMTLLKRSANGYDFDYMIVFGHIFTIIFISHDLIISLRSKVKAICVAREE